MKIEILITDVEHPINASLQGLKSRLDRNHSVSIVSSTKDVTDGDLLFLVSCSVRVDLEIIERFKRTLVLHASDLPKGRGWSPHIWELLNGAEYITVSLLDASEEIDCGDIYQKIKVDIPRSALWDEINYLLFSAEIKLIEFAIENFENLQKYPQNPSVEATYYPKRRPQDSEIDVHRSISDQFDLIRLCDPNRFPARFEFRGSVYKITLEKI